MSMDRKKNGERGMNNRRNDAGLKCYVGYLSCVPNFLLGHVQAFGDSLKVGREKVSRNWRSNLEM